MILSGGDMFGLTSEARHMADVAESIGMDAKDIICEPDSKDTKDQAILIKSLTGGRQFILVTSASHMPRSMALFKKMGMSPVPAPAGHLTSKGPSGPGSYFPSSKNLAKSENLIHEYLGIAWAKLRGQI